MKRLLVALLAAFVVTAIAPHTRAHAAALPSLQAAGQCTANCTPDLYAAGASEPGQRVQPPPAQKLTVWLAVLLSMSVTTLGILVLTARVRKQKLLSAAREAQMLQEWAIPAALARKRLDGAAPTVVPSKPEPTVVTEKRSPKAAIAAQSADCYWAYQARQSRVSLGS